MKRPAPKKNAECGCCLKVKPLLMPVAYIPGMPVVVWELQCLECRLLHRYERAQTNDHGCPAELWRYASHPPMREGYRLWLLVENPCGPCVCEPSTQKNA